MSRFYLNGGLYADAVGRQLGRSYKWEYVLPLLSTILFEKVAFVPGTLDFLCYYIDQEAYVNWSDDWTNILAAVPTHPPLRTPDS